MKKIVYFLCLPLSLLPFSCSQDDVEIPMTDKMELAHPEMQYVGISPDITYLESSDAKIVASRFINNGLNSRSESKTIKNVVPIQNAEGETALYAVNFDNGYVIVSATKNLPPIVAIVDNGNFSLNDTPSGRDVIISQLVAETDYWRENGGNNRHKDEWRLYTRFPTDEIKPFSRTDAETDPWNAMYGQLNEFLGMDYECYRISRFEDDQEVMPAEILARFQNIARHEDNIWEEEWGEDIMFETALIVIKSGHNSSYGGYCMKTTWNQISPYNYLLPNNQNLGCVTIAVGQIMKYHEYPKTYNWNEMPNALARRSDCALTSFLKKLHDELGVAADGSTNNKNAARVLKSYGYSATTKTHNTGNYSSFPVYCYGADIENNGEHAWVCDGSTYSTFSTKYELYVLDNSYYPKFKYMLRSEDTKYGSSQALYHMNWGWGGLSDGYFADSYLSANNGSKIYHFNYDRVDTYITKP